MSGSLQEVKKKIAGVQNTRKITKAMQLVAASKMRQFQKKAITARGFAWDLFKIIKSNLTEGDQSIFTEQRESGKTLFVLYTSDKGLCGPLNNKLINGLFRSNKWNDLPEEQRLLITIGKKSNGYAKSNKIPVLEHFTAIPEKLTNLDAIQVIDKVLEHWKGGEIKEVIFVAPHYKNSFTFYPVIKTFLPFSEEGIKSNLHIQEDEDTHIEDSENNDGNQSMIFSPSQEEVLEKLYHQIIQAMFIQSFLELKASEYSSRMMAMQSATDAADKLTSELKITYNKARQQNITQEIAELIGASIALEDTN